MDGGYSVGTIAVANGSKNVVGVGTSWFQSNFQAGDKLYSGGFAPGVIATVTDDTHLTLVDNWSGTSRAAGSSYRLEYQPDLSRAHGDNRTLLAQIAAGPLALIALLTGIAADTMPYFNSGASATLTALTNVGRGLVGATTGIASIDAQTANGATIASAATLNLNAATGDVIDVSGAVTTTSITLAAGAKRTVRATGAWPITVSGAIVLNNNGSNYVCAAGDIIHFRGYSGGVVRGIIFPIDGLGASGGTAGFYNQGTSGGTVPLLNGANSWSAAQAINALLDLSGSSGGNVSMPATQHSSAGANVWDDYEEGLYTPGVVSATGTITTVTAISGAYTKTGRLVQYATDLTISANGTGATAIKVDLAFNCIIPLMGSHSGTLGASPAPSVTGLYAGVSTAMSWIKYDGTYPNTGTSTRMLSGGSYHTAT